MRQSVTDLEPNFVTDFYGVNVVFLAGKEVIWSQLEWRGTEDAKLVTPDADIYGGLFEVAPASSPHIFWVARCCCLGRDERCGWRAPSLFFPSFIFFYFCKTPNIIKSDQVWNLWPFSLCTGSLPFFFDKGFRKRALPSNGSFPFLFDRGTIVLIMRIVYCLSLSPFF